MRALIRVLFFLLVPLLAQADLSVGVGKTDITPPIGAPSAGYTERQGAGMEGVHDPLLAQALLINSDEVKIAFCTVDNLGFTYDMVQAVTGKVQSHPGLENCLIFLGSSHTHSGGGGFMDFPVIGAALAGPYNAELTQMYIDKTAEAIIQAGQAMVPAKIGIGYGQAENLSKYRGQWPEQVEPLSEVMVMKVTRLDGTPLAVLFNYPLHPTILKSQNRLFSADFVGYARDQIQFLLGRDVQALYFNGAQGDIIPAVEDNRFETCEATGKSLAQTVQKIWEATETVDDFSSIEFKNYVYSFVPKPTPNGLTLPVPLHMTELNLLIFNKKHAFMAIPGELSCVYDHRFKGKGKELGYKVSILGLTNDAHGYIITPESWRHKTFESGLSFGGENYGSEVEAMVFQMMEDDDQDDEDDQE